MPETHRCCECTSRNCNRCVCARRQHPCTNCRPGARCQNRHQESEEDIIPPIDATPGVATQGNDDGENAVDQQQPAIRRFWQSLPSEEAKQKIEHMYKKVIGFSPNNLFEIPTCNATKDLIREITYLINEYTAGTHINEIALTTVATLPHLLCQRTHKKSKSSDDIKALKRRLEIWKRGDIDALFTEAMALQMRRRKLERKKKEVNHHKRFASLMMHGKVSAACRALNDEDKSGPLPLNDNTKRELGEKHPPASEAVPESLFEGSFETPPPEIFESITGDRIWRHALNTHGAAGPSGLDAKAWKSLMSHSKFGSVATDLCNAVAALACKLATENCQNIEALTAGRLMALDKRPGCRPIGIGEALRRIIGKAIMEVVKDDVKKAVGNLQVCAGQQAGCEAAIHAMRHIYDEPDCDAVLMVDASNAFNNINRQATIHNTKMKCPSFATYVSNLYSKPAQLFINDRDSNTYETIESAEGTTQGDPVAMAMYAIGLMKLQDVTRYEVTEVKQVAYADDLAGAGKLVKLRNWWEMILTHGPQQGYHPNATKSVLIVKPDLLDLANEVFSDTEVKITAGGEKHLGAAIGTTEAKDEFVSQQVEKWKSEIKELAQVAEIEPHAAYTAFTFGVRHKWNHIMRTVPNIEHLLQPLEDAIRTEFIPALTGRHNPTDLERQIMELPPRLGGLGIPNPCKLARLENENSLKLTASLTHHIENQDPHGEIDLEAQKRIRGEISNSRLAQQKADLQHLQEGLSPVMQRRLDMAQEVGSSNWLTALPIKKRGFSLNKQEFTDALALRYGWAVNDLHHQCTCGASFEPNHAMTCKTGGFVCMRHDEVRDITAQMLGEVCHDVRVEPPLLPTAGRTFELASANTADDARLDISANGFWVRGQRAFFDVRIFNPMAHSNRDLELKAAHKRSENQKIREYGERILEVEQGSFTPLVFTTSGGLAPKALTFYSCLAQQLAEKRKQAKSCVVAWMRCRLSFSLLRSALLCLRGTRKKPQAATHIRELDIEECVIESRIDRNL